MALPSFSPARTVLIIEDDSLGIYNVTRNAVRLVDTVPWSTDNFDDHVHRIIRQECGGKPVLLINDMTDQHFKGGQRMPKVSFFDRQNVLDRKLQVAFPNYPIRGALEVKGSRKSRGNADAEPGVPGSASGLYLFAALPMSEPIVKSMEAVKSSMASISGLVLLPIEAADMVSALSVKLAGRERDTSRWVIFIGQHQNGALRQVIIRDGQLAMTRMTPGAEGGDTRWAAHVAQEIKSTVSYLSRFGYSPEDSTDLIVVATPEAGDLLRDQIEIPCNYTSFTVNEAARLLGLGIGLQENSNYADALHAAWIGRKSRFILPMKAVELTSVSRPRRYAAAAMILFAASIIYFGSQIVAQVASLAQNRGKLHEQQKVMLATGEEENSETKRLQSLGFDVKLIQAAMSTYTDLQKNEMRPLELVRKIGQSLGGELRLTSLKMEMVDAGKGLLQDAMNYVSSADTEAPSNPAPDPGQDATSAVPKEVMATLSLNFPSTIDPKLGVQQINDFQNRLKAILPGYSVNITRQVADLSYNTSTSGKIGAVADPATAENQDYSAELQIRGRAHD